MIDVLLLVGLFLQGHKLKENLTPVLNLLTESARVHRQTRKFLKARVRCAQPHLQGAALRGGEARKALQTPLLWVAEAFGTHSDLSPSLWPCRCCPRCGTCGTGRRWGIPCGTSW